MRKFRFKIVDRCNNVNYLSVIDGNASLQSKNGAPLSLSNIAHDNTTLLRFALEDAKSLDDALRAVRMYAPSCQVEAFVPTQKAPMDYVFLVVADFHDTGRQIWRAGPFDSEQDAVEEF